MLASWVHNPNATIVKRMQLQITPQGFKEDLILENLRLNEKTKG